MHRFIRNLKALRRQFYSMRMFIPWMREIHILEQMVVLWDFGMNYNHTS
jgi:hypothetical protein